MGMCEYCHSFQGHFPGCPNAPEPEYIHCNGCGAEIFEDEAKYLLDEPYCDDCYKEALIEKADPYFEEYIANHEMDYYKSWFESEYLDNDQRLDAYKMAYLIRKPFDKEYLRLDRENYCFECDDFLDYLKGRIEDD